MCFASFRSLPWRCGNFSVELLIFILIISCNWGTSCNSDAHLLLFPCYSYLWSRQKKLEVRKSNDQILSGIRTILVRQLNINDVKTKSKKWVLRSCWEFSTWKEWTRSRGLGDEWNYFYWCCMYQSRCWHRSSWGMLKKILILCLCWRWQ